MITINSLGQEINNPEKFWEWFGDSKVVDENGQPMVFYHGTNNKFDTFIAEYPSQALGNFKGVYFVDNEEEAKDYGDDIKACYVKIENPLVGNPYEEYAKAKGIDYQKNFFNIKKADVENWMKEMKFDGIIRPRGSQYNLEGMEVIPFSSNQIKSIDNKGTWSKTSDNIYETKALPQNINNNFDKWFKGSKVVDKDGNPLICYHGTPNGGFTSFKSNSHFTSDKDYAEVYHNQGASSISYKKTADNPMTYAVYLSIKNPFDTRIQKCKDIFLNEYQAYYSPDLTERGMIDWLEVEELTEWLKENHPEYDGIFADEGGVGGYGYEVKHRGISYVPFNPNQIKSINNKGTWSKTSDNIYESLNEENYLCHSIKESLNENLDHDKETDMYFTQSVNDIEYLLNKKPRAYRVLYDKNIDLYMVGRMADVVHLNLFERAWDLGYYHEFYDKISSRDYWKKESDNLCFLCCIPWYPVDEADMYGSDNEEKEDLSCDGYSNIYRYEDFYDIASRDNNYLNFYKTDLFNLLPTPDEITDIKDYCE